MSTASQFFGSEVDLTSEQTVSGKKTFDNIVFKKYTETTSTLTGTTPSLEPVNGTIQKWVLSANSTLSVNLADGESVTLIIDNSGSFTVTWSGITKWLGGSAPTLSTTTDNVINFWSFGLEIYGTFVGELS